MGLIVTSVWVAASLAEPLATVERLRPVLPENDAVVGPHTLFEIGYDAPGDPHPRDLRFRIRLQPLRDEGREYVFDQRQGGGGWLVGEPGRVLFRPSRPLADGAYRWDVAAWNGLDWVEGASRFEIRVDSVAPADVEGLKVERDLEAGRVVLTWKPVTLDRDARPEYVARYHVYRYKHGTPLRRVRVHEIATVPEPRFVDTEATALAEPLLLYRVTAEDEAGNEGGPD
jgi:hypothetical protein